MSFAPIPEYEGKSPYVFITYAQQDEKIAYAIAVKMYNEGFRIWSSAACGNPSNMRIAERLSNSAVAMVFLSKSYVKYASYNEFEPRIVMSNPKKKIVVCLDDTPIGTDWNTVDFPAGIRYNPDFPQDMWLKINSSDALEACRGAWPSKPMPMPFQDAPAIKVSVDSINENELEGELNSLNSVMASFGAGLDDDEISNITLFKKKKDSNKFSWNERIEPSQEQEYYTIENLIDNAPMPAEKKQYDSMVGLIENFMENRSRTASSVHNDSGSTESDYPPKIYTPINGDYTAVPLNKFNSVDMTSASKKPLLFTNSAEDVLPVGSKAPAAPQSFNSFIMDYGDDETFGEGHHGGYTMTRTASRSDRFAYNPVRSAEPENKQNTVTETVANIAADDKKPVKRNDEEKPVFEKIVDDRKFITSTEDNMDSAKLTYHLGILDNFNEADYIDSPEQSEKPEQTESPKYEPVDHIPVKFTDDDIPIPLPAISFDKPKSAPAASEPVELPSVHSSKPTIHPPRRLRANVRKHWRVGIRTRINHIEYGNEMYKVNGRWIPSQIYYEKMPNAKYTEVKRMPVKEECEFHSLKSNENSRLSVNSRLFGAVNTFRTPQPHLDEHMSYEMLSEIRRRREERRSEAIRRFEVEREAAAAALAAYNSSSYGSSVNNYNQNFYNAPAPQPNFDEEDISARKYKYSHEAGIKKSLYANMDSPINIDITDQSHRQYGSRAELANSEYIKPESEDVNQKKKQKEIDSDDDTIVAIPIYSQPKISYDPSVYKDMNLSEILFSDIPKNNKKSKKKKKK